MLPNEYRLISKLPWLTSLSLYGYVHVGGIAIGIEPPQADDRIVEEWRDCDRGTMFEGIHHDYWFRVNCPLLLCLHSVRNTLRYLDLQAIDMDGLVMEECSMMPCVQVLRMGKQDRCWTDYTYLCLVQSFPSLTSLTLTSSCKAAVQLVSSLALLEEVQWPNLNHQEGLTVQHASGCSHIRGLIFTDGHLNDPPPLASVTALLRLPLLVRLTIDARYLCETHCEALFSSSSDLCFPFLRCLEMRPARVPQRHVAPQTDAALRFFVLPPCLQPVGRTKRQAERMIGRRMRRFEEGPTWGIAHPEVLAAEQSWWDALYTAHSPSNFPFPVLECLDLPYKLYGVKRRGPDFEGSSRVSARMVAELRRSYEWERVEEWEVEMVTMGAAEWKKTCVIQTW